MILPLPDFELVVGHGTDHSLDIEPVKKQDDIA